MSWEEVGKRIADIRHKKNLTQAQFGTLLGVSRQNIGKIERGQKSPGDLIPVICKITGTSADFIYFGIVDPLVNIRLLYDFTPSQLDIALDIIKRITEMIYSPNGNELLIKEVMRRQCLPTEN